MEIKNALIESTMLGREDHGIMTFDLFLKTDCFSIGFGGYAIDQYDKENECRKFRGTGLEAISRILDVVGVSKWEDLPGKYIRYEENGWGTPIDTIGNIIKDKWFNIRKFFEEKQNEVE